MHSEHLGDLGNFGFGLFEDGHSSILSHEWQYLV